ncbi:MAG TPA: P-II family nitrogen regulator [Propionibacteriaceae bacterium]|nr:P-II family nitrogen regulator [Propionibacteriaceae bacterium]HPZ49440.1 P-II family nitrogen regulator [Propionibacteriaceae bacterium]HQE32195.1 P-II family nitrogen regulator [Propionibacteriaceae bacterium]
MKLVTAIVQPHALAEVQLALAKHDVNGMTVTETSGYARQRGHSEVYRGEEFTIDFILKVKIEILCADEESDEIVDLIASTARSGQIGDGKVWVTPVDQVVRIRTGEVGAAAI